MANRDTYSFVIDSHAHCGIGDRSFHQSFEDYFSRIEHTQIRTVVMFPPVMEIYDRYDPGFEDTPQWQDKRKQANSYILGLGNTRLSVIPYFFIWNDFNVGQLTAQHKGIKWHRHSNEPVYHYNTKECKAALLEIKKRNMPVVYEEELKNTILFITDLARDIRVIIPHLGGLNGGYEAIASAGLWQKENVYTDTALASSWEISDYIENFGHERILFGSDFPFGEPGSELNKVKNLNLAPEIEEEVVRGNITRLISTSNIQ